MRTYKETYINKCKKILLNIKDTKNRFQIISIKNILGFPITDYKTYIENNLGVVELQRPMECIIEYKIIPPIV